MFGPFGRVLGWCRFRGRAFFCPVFAFLDFGVVGKVAFGCRSAAGLSFAVSVSGGSWRFAAFAPLVRVRLRCVAAASLSWRISAYGGRRAVSQVLFGIRLRPGCVPQIAMRLFFAVLLAVFAT